MPSYRASPGVWWKLVVWGAAPALDFDGFGLLLPSSSSVAAAVKWNTYSMQLCTYIMSLCANRPVPVVDAWADSAASTITRCRENTARFTAVMKVASVSGSSRSAACGR